MITNEDLDREYRDVRDEVETEEVEDKTLYCHIILMLIYAFPNYSDIGCDDLMQIYEYYQHLRKFNIVR